MKELTKYRRSISGPIAKRRWSYWTQHQLTRRMRGCCPNSQNGCIRRRCLALTIMAVTITGSWGAPAHATPGGRSGSTVQLRPDGTEIARPGGAEPGQLDLGMTAAVTGSALAVGILLVGRPRAARRRALHRFRALLVDADVDSICSKPAGHDHRDHPSRGGGHSEGERK